MKCIYCGSENETRNEVCYKCGAALNKFRIDRFTRILIIVSTIIALAIGSSQVVSLIVYFDVMAVNSRIIFFLFAVVNVLITVSTVLFFMRKKKIFVILDGVGWILFSACIYFGGGSPIFAMLLIMPYIYAVLRMVPQWKYLG